MMFEYGRLSRRDRLRLSGRRRFQFALALAFLLLMLIVLRIWWPQLRGLIYPPNYGEIQAVAESLIEQAGRSFALSDTITVDTLLNRRNPRGEIYLCRQYSQPWPGILPFEFYVQRLQELCRDKGLICSCQESGENHLDCAVGLHDFDGAVVLVRRTARTELTGRRVAFLFKNLGALENDKIMRMAENGIAFSYMATPDVYPSAAVKKALERAEVTSILEIPAERSGLTGFAGLATAKQGQADMPNDRDLAASLFERHPNPGAIIIKRSGRMDPSFVAGIIEEAKKHKTAYIYENMSPDVVDSLAYSSGMVILSMKDVADFSDGRFDSNSSACLRKLILSPGSMPLIVVFDGSKVEVEDLFGLQKSFRRLGIKLMDSISLMEIRESL